MATTALRDGARPKPKPLAPDRIDRILAAASLLLLFFVLAALARGRAEWHLLPPLLWTHILTVLVALALTPLMLLRRRGDRLHRRLGWIWAAALAGTALVSFGIRGIGNGSLSPIHLLSVWTLIQVPLVVRYARRHDHDRHRRAVRFMVAGALLIAGFFTFPFGRQLGLWLLG